MDGNDFSNGGRGSNRLEGGGGSDTFIIIPDPGTTDTIVDFAKSTGNYDELDLQAFPEIRSFGELLAHATQSGTDIVLNLGTKTVVIQNFSLGNLIPQEIIGNAGTPSSPPTVTTPTASTLTLTSALLGGFVASDGNSFITERGVVYALASVNSNPQIGGAGVTKIPAAGATGTFSVNVGGLTNQGVYAFAAYATNSAGTRYTPVSTMLVDLPPVVSNMESTSLAYKANDAAFPPLAISSAVTVFEPDSTNLTKATVQVTSGYQNDSNGKDVLAFTNKYGISGTFDASTGTLTLSGTAYVGYYREALRSVTFSSSGTNVSSANRVLTIIASDDGAPIPAVSQPVTRTVSVLTTNVPPSLSGVSGTPLVYIQGATPIAVAPTATVTDLDSINLAGATIQVTGNYQSGKDILSAITSGTRVATAFNTATGTLALTGIDSLVNYQAVLRSVAFYTSPISGSTLTRSLAFVLNDGLMNSPSVTRDINVAPYNFPPAVVGIEMLPLAYKANDPAFPPAPISNTVAITDPDSNSLTKVTIQITSGYQNDANGKDLLAFSNKYGISGTFDANTGTLTLTGSAYVGLYREALRTVTFSTSGTNVSAASRILTIIATDDNAPIPATSQSVTRTVTVTGSMTDVPPSLSGVPATPLSYVLGSTPVAVSSTATVADPDSSNLLGATIQISGNYQSGKDRLSAVTTGTGITQSFDASAGTLTLSGIDTLASYQAVLRSVAFGTNSTVASTLTRTLTLLLNDGLASSTPVTRDINVIPFNYPPVLVGIEASPLAYKANDPAFPPLPISSMIAITDPDSNNLTKVTIQITSGYQNDANGKDLLAFTDKTGITGSFDAASGTLTLTGAAYVGSYREALRSVAFSSSGTNVSTANRILTIIATDDGAPNAGVSQPVTRTVTISTTNLPPVLNGVPGSPLVYSRGTAAVVVAQTATIADSDSINLMGATVQISANYQNGQDVLGAVTTGTAITAVFDAVSGKLTLSGLASLASYQTVMNSVTYKTNSTAANLLTRTLTFVLNDGLASSVAVNRSITLS